MVDGLLIAVSPCVKLMFQVIEFGAEMRHVLGCPDGRGSVPALARSPVEARSCRSKESFPMAELGVVRRYAYWADRRIRAIGVDNGISLDRRISWKAKLGNIPGIGGAEFAQDARALDRTEIAERIERAIGARAVQDFVTPPKVDYAKGVGRVEFAQLSGFYGRGGVVMHTSTRSSSGARVDVCLFGSLQNLADYAGASDNHPGGWTSSAAGAIELYLENREAVSNSRWYDPESLALEALKIATEQGVTGPRHEHQGKPSTRGFTLGQAKESEWLAEIYEDVVLDKDRWTFSHDETGHGVDRILIGAPLWIRTPSPQAVTRFRDLR
ncbi:hypothetical protein [Amycolatopsis marina]|uniref:hypothetical protein n=1 Tax=Amycolatopsis marina TaxID=490629 RepID=UPI001160A598|nr:hypothetical protein [Amycolatopsis marina]